MYDALEYKGVVISTRKMNQIPQMVASIQGISYPPIIPTDDLSTISAKTNAITQIKDQIKNVIENCGVATTDNLSLFGSYIRQISSGSQHTLVIEGLNVVEGYSVKYSILYDGQSPSGQGVWSVVSGGTYGSINSSTGELTINNTANNSQITIQCIYGGVTATFTLTATYQSGKSIDTETETTTDPDTGETTTTTTTVITNGDGSSTSTSSSTTTDENGNITGTSTSNKTTNTDGSSSSTTTNYDVDGNPTTGSNNTVDTSGNSNTQEITYDGSGNPEVTGYTIDTTNNPSGNGEEITTGLDTGVIVFDGNDWEANLTFKVHDYLAITNNPFFSAMYKENNKANGIVVYGFKGYGGTHYNESDTVISSSSSTNPVMRMKVNEWNNGSIQSDSYEFYSKHQTAYSQYRFGTRTNPITLTLKATCNGNTLTVELYYNNQVTAKPRYSHQYTFNSASDKDVTFKLGEMTTNSATVYAQNFEVLDFTVRKL